MAAIETSGVTAAPRLTSAERRWATTALMLATAMQAADATIINVALPRLERDLGSGLTLGSWVLTSYLCAAAIVVPLTGWLRRKLGPRQLYLGAIWLFVTASLLCAAAPSGPAIIGFRFLQGAGGGVIPALTQAFLHDLHPRQRHPRVLAIWGAVAMAGPIIGPMLGGTITDLASWRWVFLVNLPIGVAATWRMRRLLPRADTDAKARLDILGLLLLLAGIGALQLFLQRCIGGAWLDRPDLLAEAVVAAAAVGITISRSVRSQRTILRLDVFRDRTFAAAAFFNFMTSALLFVAIVFVPLLTEGPLGYRPTIAGLTIVPRAIMMMLALLATGRLVESVDYRLALAAGLCLMAIGAGLVAMSEPAPAQLWWIIAGSTVQAVGAGMILMPLSTVAFATLPRDMRTDAAGLYSLLRQLGCAGGFALMSAVLQARIGVRLAALSPAAGVPAGVSQLLANRAIALAYADCFAIIAVVSLVLVPAVSLFASVMRAKAAE